MDLNTIVKIEYDSVFEAQKGNRWLEKLRGKPIERDHIYGVLKFQVTKYEYESLVDNHVGCKVIEE